jgi:hypothetical protein
MISVSVTDNITYHNAVIIISDLNGREVNRKPIELNLGINEITYEHGFNMTGTYIYSLIVDGKIIQSRRMVFAN